MKTKHAKALLAAASILSMLFITSCESPNPGTLANSSFSSREAPTLPWNRPRSLISPPAPEAKRADEAQSRPGLATTAGYDRYSSVESGIFHRKSLGQPDATDHFYYNDEVGAKAMTGALGGGREHSGLFAVAGERLKVGLSTYDGVLPHLEADGNRVVLGRSGNTYGIRLKNTTKKRVEVVTSVDGLDVLDGKAASTKKNGYVLEAGEEYTIEGFRKNNEQVRQFKFGSVSKSEAAKQGEARNVGVIGLAVYEEDEAAAKAARLSEALKRAGAQAFH